jgi:hypothetical protein
MTALPEVERERRMFWTFDEARVFEVEGFSCPESPGYWWCPRAGSSMYEGVHLLPTREEAIGRAKLAAGKRLVEAQRVVDALETL